MKTEVLKYLMSDNKKYDYITEYSDGLAHVVLNNMHGFINENGNEIIPIIYELAFDFIHDFARVTLNGKWGIYR
jgi:hypothetical protein